MSTADRELHVSVWKQRLFEIGAVLVAVIIGMEFMVGHVPYHLEVAFVAVAVLSILFQSRKSYRWFRLSQHEIEISSPKTFGRSYTFEISTIAKIEENSGIYTTLEISTTDGKIEKIILQRLLGFCYSRELEAQLRSILRNSEINYEIDEST